MIGRLLVCASAGMSTAMAQRLQRHVMSQLVCLGTHTITAVLCTSGRQQHDWSADYRLYGRDRVDPEALFCSVRSLITGSGSGPVVIAVDDTQITKSGRKTFGVKYARDAMGPPFHLNLIRAQRFVQTSMAWPGPGGSARMIPVDWQHAPQPVVVPTDASPVQHRQYAAARKASRLSQVGAGRIAHLRCWLDEAGLQQRRLWSVVDGSYTNSTVLKQLPQRTTLVGRIRSDAKLYYLPDGQCPGAGRRRVYGRRAPTPQQVRTDETVPWRDITVFFGGKQRQLRVKSINPLRWPSAGKNFDLQLIVIAPTPRRHFSRSCSTISGDGTSRLTSATKRVC